jgi:hypothetical protein
MIPMLAAEQLSRKLNHLAGVTCTAYQLSCDDC